MKVTKKCLITVQCGLLLAIGSGCVIVPANPRPRTVVVHRPAPPPPAPLVVVEKPRPTPPPVVVVEAPQPVVPAPVVVVEAPRPRPPVVVVEKPRPVITPAPVVVHARTPAPEPSVVIITPREREVIRTYYVFHKRGNGNSHGNRDKGLPKGIAKKVERGDSLPPGWQKKCVRGQIMPTEVFKHCEPLPHDVVVKLPPAPVGTVIVTLEGKAVRLMQATLEILDVFEVI